MRKIIISAIAIIALVSCDVLDQEVFSTLTTESYLRNYEEANQAVIGVYSVLNNTYYYKRGFPMVTGFTSDDSYHNGAIFTVFDDGTLKPTNSYVTNLWDNIYYLNGQANFTIDALKSINDLTEEERELLIARVKFIRALNMYNAVRLWGDIPLIKEYSVDKENLYPPRSPKADVYAFIETDLLEASSNLPETSEEYGYPNKAAALGLLAKAYMSQEKWQDANTALNDFFNVSAYSLVDNYLDVFDVTKENNSEDIFSIQFKKDDQISGESSLGGLLPFWFLPAFADLDYIADPNGPKGQMRIEHASYDRYTSGDYETDDRNELFITSYVNSKSGKTVKRYPENSSAAALGPHYSKYRDPVNTNDRNYNNNLYILRYADILLMKAEVENELNGPTTAAYNAFNQVRLRSNETALAEGLSKDEFRDAISDERGIEFLGEFQRWFDQTRMKKNNGDSYYKYMKEKLATEGNFTHPAQNRWALGYYPKYELMPIPAAEIAINPNINIEDQNPGY